MFRKLVFRFCEKISKEDMMKNKIIQELQATNVTLVDTSGGCGQMYNMVIESQQFDGKSKIEQHRMVQEVLKDELSQAHGFNLKTIIKK